MLFLFKSSVCRSLHWFCYFTNLDERTHARHICHLVRRLNLKSHAQAGQLHSLSPATCRQKIEGLLQRKVWLTGERKKNKKKKGIFTLFVKGKLCKGSLLQSQNIHAFTRFSCQSVDAVWRRLSWSSPVVFRLFIFSIGATFLCCQIKLPCCRSL